MLRDLSKKSLAARTAQKLMEHSKLNNDTHFEQRINTSITGKLGAGEEFHTSFGGTLEEFGDSRSVLIGGQHSWAGVVDHARPLLAGREWIIDKRQNGDRYMDLRTEIREGFQDPEHCFSEPGSPRAVSQQGPSTSQTNKVTRIVEDKHQQEIHEEDKPMSARQKLSQKRQVMPFEKASMGEAKEHYHRDTVMHHGTGGMTLIQMITAQIEAEKLAEEKSERSEERPFASKDVQFRRRTLRETIRIYRSQAASNLTKAGLRDVEVATADHEAEVLKLAGEVQERMTQFTFQPGEGKAKSPWLQKWKS